MRKPTGGKPNSYGDVRTLTLPNSGLTVSYSTRCFRLLPESDVDSLYPEVAAAVSSADYLAGLDPALEAIAARLGLPQVLAAR